MVIESHKEILKTDNKIKLTLVLHRALDAFCEVISAVALSHEKIFYNRIFYRTFILSDSPFACFVSIRSPIKDRKLKTSFIV